MRRQNFYHGTTQDFDELLPSSVVGGEKYDYVGFGETRPRFDPNEPYLPTTETSKGAYRGGYAFATVDEESAWRWARPTSSNSEDSRHRVYEIEPDDIAIPNPASGGPDERIMSRGRVTNTHWIPKPFENYDDYEVNHVQGTLPPLNWRQYGAPNYQQESHGFSSGSYDFAEQDERMQLEDSLVKSHMRPTQVAGQDELFPEVPDYDDDERVDMGLDAMQDRTRKYKRVMKAGTTAV